MEIKVDTVEDLLWSEGVEFDLIPSEDGSFLRVLGLREPIIVKQIWNDNDGEPIFDPDDIYVYAGGELFGQISADTADELVQELLKILENYR